MISQEIIDEVIDNVLQIAESMGLVGLYLQDDNALILSIPCRNTMMKWI